MVDINNIMIDYVRGIPREPSAWIAENGSLTPWSIQCAKYFEEILKTSFIFFVLEFASLE